MVFSFCSLHIMASTMAPVFLNSEQSSYVLVKTEKDVRKGDTTVLLFNSQVLKLQEHDGISDYRKEGRCLKINYDVFTQHILGLIITATKLMKDASVQPKVLMNERTADGWTCQIIIHPVSHKAAVDIR